MRGGMGLGLALLERRSYAAECFFEVALQHDVSAADHGADCEDCSCWGGCDELEVLGLAAVEEAGRKEDDGDHDGEAGVQDIVHAKA
jgi:hypothetical protein